MKREEAIQVLQTALTSPFIYGEYADAISMAIEALQFQEIMINNPKTAKPTPMVCKNCQENNRPKGEWVKDECKDGEQWYRCSNCGERYVLIETSGRSLDVGFPFCPNCTADMRGDTE